MVGLAQPIITLQPADFSVSLGATVTHQVIASGAGASREYQWRLNELALMNATNRTLVFTNVQSTHAGGYSVVVSDTTGSVTSRVAVLTVDPTFTKITTGAIVNDGGDSAGCAWGDYDNDGYVDLFVANRGGQNNFLYRNQRNGAFEKITAGRIVTDGGNSRGGGAWADYNNDGWLDLIVANTFEPNFLYHNNGDGTFARVTSAAAGSIVAKTGATHSCAWGDFDNDGHVDLFEPNAFDEPSFLHRNRGNGSFTEENTSVVVMDRGNPFVAVWSDYDNDGRLDLFLARGGFRGSENNFLYRNEGGSHFTKLSAATVGSVVNDGGYSLGAAWGDYDNDGFQDLFVANGQGSGAARLNFLYHNSGDGRFTRMTTNTVGSLASDLGQSIGCAWGDYDNDGFLDLFVATAIGTKLLYHNNTDGSFTRIDSGSLVNDFGTSLSCAWADYDNDGFLDLFVANGGENNALYRNAGNDNSSISLRLVGTQSNRSAIGAKVRVKATIGGKAFWQVREISGGSGYGSQNDLRAHFGLGDATNADLIRIEWPSGVVQELREVAARQVLAIQESNADIFPAQADVSLGATLTLSVTNAPPDSALQWRLNGIDIAGATNATLEFSNATTNLNGHYTVVVSNATGSVFPRPAVVRIFDRPIITSQPQSTNALPGASATFSVAALSPSLPITYQWQFNGVDLPGQTGSTLTLTNLQLAQDGLYTVVATDALGSVTSEPAAMRVLVKPVIVQGPISQSIVAGGSVTFSTEITGNPAPFLYQWRQASTTLTNMVLSEKRAFFTLNNIRTNQAGLYRVVITNAASPSLTVNATWNLTVLPDTDGDGLPDAWETAHGLSANEPADAALDSDGDGQSNLGEYRAGTNPTNAASCLKVESVTHANGQTTVSFHAVSNQTYTVEWCADLGGTWTKLTDLIARTNSRVESVTDSSARDAARFYRVCNPRRP